MKSHSIRRLALNLFIPLRGDIRDDRLTNLQVKPVHNVQYFWSLLTKYHLSTY